MSNPLSADPLSARVREAAWRQTEPLFADGAPEARREAIRRAQFFGLTQAYPQLVREAYGEDGENRRAALAAIRNFGSRTSGDLVLPGDVESERDKTRAEAMEASSDASGATELRCLHDYAERTLASLRATKEERHAYLRDLIDDLGEDYDYGPEDVPGGCGIRIGGGPDVSLRFLAERARVDFNAVVKAYLSDSDAMARGQLIDKLVEFQMVTPFIPSIRPLLDHPRTGIRVPAMLALGGKLSIPELKKRMEGDPSGAVRVVAFWDLAAHDEEMALKLALPRLAKMVTDERFQVLARLYDARDGRKRLRALTNHQDATVAKEARDLVRDIDAQDRDTIRP